RQLVQTHAETVTELEPEGLHLVLEAEVLGPRPGAGDDVSRHTGLDEIDAGVDPLPGALVGIVLAGRGPTDAERPVIARPVAVEGLNDVEERLVARSDQPVREDVGMGTAAL